MAAAGWAVVAKAAAAVEGLVGWAAAAVAEEGSAGAGWAGED